MTPAITRDAAAGARAHESHENACDLPQLAVRLFDLRAALEKEVRTLTWVQRSIEEIRAGHACGDHDLLLREIARLFDASLVGAAAINRYRDDAITMLAAIIAERDRSSAQRNAPLAIVA